MKLEAMSFNKQDEKSGYVQLYKYEKTNLKYDTHLYTVLNMAEYLSTNAFSLVREATVLMLSMASSEICDRKKHLKHIKPL